MKLNPLKTQAIYWPFLTIINLIFAYLIAYPLAPIIALFVKDDGYLPKYLWWFQTPDSKMDGCNGDVNFCNLNQGRNKWWTATRWQWRNTAHGFAHMLGTSFANPKIKSFGKPEQIGRLPTYRPGWYLLIVTDEDGRSAFEFAATWDAFPTTCWNIRLGWKLSNLYGKPEANIQLADRVNPFSARGPLPSQ